MAWPLPSPRVRELFRQGARLVLEVPPEWLDELDEAVFGARSMEVIAEDPELRAAAARASRTSLLHWARSNIEAPGSPVEPTIENQVRVTRDLIRRGLDEQALDSYRTAQDVAWRRWMQLAFTLTTDAGELQELLEVSHQSISAFIDATIAATAARIAEERDELTRGSAAQRREIVTLLLEGVPTDIDRAAHVLGYRLDQTHLAAIVWTTAPDSDVAELEEAGRDLADRTAATDALRLVASAGTVWVWLASPALDRVHGLAVPEHLRVAVGSEAAGVDGFRRSHIDALSTQRMLARLQSPEKLATFDEVEVVLALTENLELADAFVRRTLGRLASSSREMRETVLAYVREGENAQRTAARLYAHRNTVLRRLERADQLLPRPLRANAVNVAVALEVLRWRGSPAPPASAGSSVPSRPR